MWLLGLCELVLIYLPISVHKVYKTFPHTNDNIWSIYESEVYLNWDILLSIYLHFLKGDPKDSKIQTPQQTFNHTSCTISGWNVFTLGISGYFSCKMCFCMTQVTLFLFDGLMLICCNVTEWFSSNTNFIGFIFASFLTPHLTHWQILEIYL